MGLSRSTAVFTAVVAFVAGGVIAAGSAFAYTQEQQDACTPDAMRLCSAFIPDVDRITVCMSQNKTQLTPRCAVYFKQPVRAGLAPPRQGRPQSIKPRLADPGQQAEAPKAVARQPNLAGCSGCNRDDATS